MAGTKKKKKPNPLDPPKSQHQTPSDAILHLFTEERRKMLSKAKSSAKKHGVQLVDGTPNIGKGDCAFESVILNINDRPCFNEKLPMDIDYYRRIWMTDMMNRTAADPNWKIYPEKIWREGWEEMLKPGTYERGIFGDLMLPGIACGVKKFILIFNTRLDSPHDPIYVIDPGNFDVQPDTDIPVVLAYNQSHYESMHPHSDVDRIRTTQLVKNDLLGKYKFTKKISHSC